MFSLMANCFTWIKKRREPRKKVTLLMVGLDNAGKTSTVASVRGEQVDNITPTVGFLMANFTFEKSEVRVFDLGGGPNIRAIWTNYFSESYGVIYVVDSSDELRIDEGKKVLHELVSHSKVLGKPLLVLANKKDKEGAMSEHEIDQRLDLSHLSQKYNTPYQVYSCSAVLGTASKLDKQIKKGLQWLLSSIATDYSSISERVNNDVAIQKEEQAKENARIREVVRKRREERERAEAEAELAAQNKEEESDDGLVIGTKKKKRHPQSDTSPEVTKKKKKKKKKKKIVESDHEDDDIELQNSSRFTSESPPSTLKFENDIDPESDHEDSEKKTKKRRHKKKHQIVEDNEDEIISQVIEPKHGSPRTISYDNQDHEENEIDYHRRHKQDHRETSDHGELSNDIVEVVRHDHEEENIAPEDNMKKKKKKKKKRKNNKTAPAPEDADEDADKLPPLGWGTPPLMNGFGHGRAPPRLEPLRPPLRSTFDPRGIAESIPEQSEDDSPVMKHSWARYRPNSEDQDIIT